MCLLNNHLVITVKNSCSDFKRYKDYEVHTVPALKGTYIL